jgi:hypothetical protein
MFKRQDSKWLITVLNHKSENHTYIILRYWLPKTSDAVEMHSTITINPFHSLEHAEEVKIPIEAMDIEFEVQTDEDNIDSFFARLLHPLEN